MPPLFSLHLAFYTAHEMQTRMLAVHEWQRNRASMSWQQTNKLSSESEEEKKWAYWTHSCVCEHWTSEWIFHIYVRWACTGAKAGDMHFSIPNESQIHSKTMLHRLTYNLWWFAVFHFIPIELARRFKWMVIFCMCYFLFVWPPVTSHQLNVNAFHFILKYSFI